jgi:DNA processing protein
MHTKISIEDSFRVLNALPHLGPVTQKRLLAAFGDDPLAVLRASPAALRRVAGVGSEISAVISGWGEYFDLAEDKAFCRDTGIRFMSWRHADYPSRLRRLYDPPIGLYCRGEPCWEGRCVGVVGCRRPSPYGMKMARTLGRQLAADGVAVVSGLARGVDSLAHEAVVESGGTTIAVLGCGIDTIYPPENDALATRITERGALLSEFPLHTPISRQNFPMRNRIVAGLVDAVVVVESDERGGSMITARFALDANRLVGAVPGRADDPVCRGCLSLLRDGAFLVRSAADILAELGAGSQIEFPNFDVEDEQNQPISDPLIATLKKGDWCAVDSLAKASGLSTTEIMGRLLLLELDGKVMRRADGRYGWK